MLQQHLSASILRTKHINYNNQIQVITAKITYGKTIWVFVIDCKVTYQLSRKDKFVHLFI